MEKVHIGGRVPYHIKKKIEQEAKDRGISQQDLIQEMAFHYYSTKNESAMAKHQDIGRDTHKRDEQQAQENDFPLLPNSFEAEEADDEDQEYDEEEYENEDDEQEDVFAVYPELLAEEINCSIIAAWDDVKMREERSLEPIPSIVSDFLLELADKLDERALTPREYECEESDGYDVHIADEQAVREITHIVYSVDSELGGSTDKVEVMETIAEFCRQRAATIYQEDREITLRFTRDQWVGIDKLLDQGNKFRLDGRMEFKHLVKLLMGEKMEEMGQGFFGPRDKQLYELGKVFQEL